VSSSPAVVRDSGTEDRRDPARFVRLRALTVTDFRNLPRLTQSLPEGGFVLIGPNGHGKTNLLEAIHYLHALRSVRGVRDIDLVRFGADGFHLAATLAGARVDEMRVGFERNGRRKKIVLDGVESSRVADALGAVPSVMFSPRDVTLVMGTPTERRRYLDIALATTSRRYLTALQRYRSALVRRSAALRDAVRGTHPHQTARVAVWEPPLAEAAAILWCARRQWTAWAAPRFAELCTTIGETQRAGLRYASTLEIPDNRDSPNEDGVRERFLIALERDRASDLRRGLTHTGPHRDDLRLTLGGRSLRVFGSAGQQRTAAIALRLVERETLLERGGRAPIVLLDDPFAELDRGRARRILGVLGEAAMGQTVLAVPRDDDVPDAYTTLERHGIRDGVLDG
jgi:DNA replication and repair protein RecF